MPAGPRPPRWVLAPQSLVPPGEGQPASLSKRPGCWWLFPSSEAHTKLPRPRPRPQALPSCPGPPALGSAPLEEKLAHEPVHTAHKATSQAHGNHRTFQQLSCEVQADGGEKKIF